MSSITIEVKGGRSFLPERTSDDGFGGAERRCRSSGLRLGQEPFRRDPRGLSCLAGRKLVCGADPPRQGGSTGRSSLPGRTSDEKCGGAERRCRSSGLRLQAKSPFGAIRGGRAVWPGESWLAGQILLGKEDLPVGPLCRGGPATKGVVVPKGLVGRQAFGLAKSPFGAIRGGRAVWPG